MELLQRIELLSRWCFTPGLGTQLVAKLAILQQQQQQQAQELGEVQELQLLHHLCTSMQQQQHAEHSGSLAPLLPLWVEVVELLVEDAVCALQFCQDCYSKALGPALYCQAKGLFKLGR